MDCTVGGMDDQIKLPVSGRAIAPYLAPQDVVAWVTLQRITLGMPGICTDTDMFYRRKGEVFVSDIQSRLLMAPGASLTFDTAFNVLGLGTLDTACRLGRLAFALCGTGQVEVSLMQGQAGRSAQRLVSDIVTLDPAVETILELERHVLTRRDGVLWVEVRALGSEEEVWLAGGRFLTDSHPDPALHLAICRPSRTMEDRPAADRMLARILDWAASQGDRVSVLTCGPVAEMSPVLITLPTTDTTHAAHVALLTAARQRGFSHALMIDPHSAISPETLDRTLALLSILRDPRQALGAGALRAAVDWQLSNNGVVRGTQGKLRPVAAQVDLRDLRNLLDISSDTAQDDGTDRALPHSTFLAFALGVLGHDPAAMLTHEAYGFEDLTTLRPGVVHVQHVPGLMIRRDTYGQKITALMTLQNLIFPEQGLCTETQMYFHGHGAVAYDELSDSISIEHNGVACFDTYFNALSIGKWHQNCRLNGLWLGVTGRGRVEVKVMHAIPDKSWEVLATTVVTLSRQNETVVDLSHYPDNAVRGMIYFEVRALSPGVSVTAARFMTEGTPDPAHRLTISITTFQREAQVENTARRLARYFERAEFADRMECLIVDNGDSAQIAPHPRIRRIVNANLGGAGGFTRGLLEAEAAGTSHVLFMDDDAAIPMEALHRAFVYLSLAKDPKTAVAGAMINSSDKWRMAENGATFDRKCYPKFGGTDLRDRDQVFGMENESALAPSSRMYGGWWFFAFPVAQVAHHPFPFFVRGDDVNFSLANEFVISTLNGVVSFADDFVDKQSPLNWYLDLRSHMVHHLTVERLKIGRFGLAGIGLSFFRRNLVKFQYESIEAVLLAWTDVLKGPDFFTANPDARQARAAIKTLTHQESWQSVADLDLTHRDGFLDRKLSARRRFYPFSLNGHFLPFYRFWGGHRVIPAWQRGHSDAVWGAVQLTFLNSARDQAYVTRRSNLKAARLLLRVMAIWLRTVLSYAKLEAVYQTRYPQITARPFWQKALALEASPPPQPDMTQPEIAA